MPATPFHLMLALPLKAALKDNFSATSFVAANILIDIEPATKLLFDLPGPLHGLSHTLLGGLAIFYAIMLYSFLFTDWKYMIGWWTGAFLGIVSHLLLDASIYPMMHPLFPMTEANPFYHFTMDQAEHFCEISGLIGFIWIGLSSLRKAGKNLGDLEDDWLGPL